MNGKPILEAELREKLATAYQVLMALGLFDYAGDATVRIPNSETFLIRKARAGLTPTSKGSMVETQTQDIIKLSMQGEQVDGDLTPPLESPLHTAIYRSRTDVCAIVHSHPRIVTAFSMVGQSIDPVFSRGLETTGTHIPIFDNPDPIGDDDLATKLADTLDQNRACILRSHGLVVVGSSLESACLASINLEQAALMQWIASFIGTPIPLPKDSIRHRQEVWDNQNMLSLVWQYYVEVTSTLPATSIIQSLKI